MLLFGQNAKGKIKENKTIDKYLHLARESEKKIVEHEVEGVTNYSWCSKNRPEKMEEKRNGGIGF